jgi:pimeloyl-ACP methyl ester carboxylesterase
LLLVLSIDDPDGPWSLLGIAGRDHNTSVACCQGGSEELCHYASVLGKHNLEVREVLRREIAALAGDPQNVKAIWDALGKFDSKDRLEEIEAPTLVLVGERFRQTHGQGRRMASLIPDARFGVVTGAGHMLNWDNTEQFNAEVLSFLADFERRR